MTQNMLISPVRLGILLGITAILHSVMCMEKGDQKAIYISHRTSDKIHIDGKLNESLWQNATRTKAFSRFGSKDRAVLHPTKAMMVWDSRNLYIAFLCTDPDVWGTLVKRDDPLYKEEVVEVYVDPDGDGKYYIELEVNPRNTVTDILMDKPYSAGGKADWKWDLENFQSAVTVDGTLNNPGDTDRGWQVEMAIPWENFRELSSDISLPPKQGDRWTINLYRIERVRGEKTEEELTAWSPTDTFHAPGNFGILRFSEEK